MSSGTLPRMEDGLESLGACPVCDSDEIADRMSRSIGLEVSVCGACGLAYLDPRPTWAVMLDHYQQDYAFQSFEEQWRDERAFDLHRDDAKRLEAAIRLPGAKVLDVGCGAGVFLGSLQRRGAGPLTGIEPSAVAAHFAAEHLGNATIAEASWENASLDGGFDAITALDVIEHLYDPVGFLRWTYAQLRLGGALYLKTPNWAAVSVHGASWSGLATDYEHVVYFSAETLAPLLVEVGYTVTFVGCEPARAGFGGELAGGPASPSRLRGIVRSVPGVNRFAYRGIQAVRRWNRRDELRVGVADTLVLTAVR